MIPQRTITEILEAARIEEVVGDFVSLRRRGTNMIGLCPFHNEKTPSFSVSPSKNIYKCFGCGKGGDPTSFVMEHENLSFSDAIRYLGVKYNIAIEEKEPTAQELQERHHLESLYLVNDFAKSYYSEQLNFTETGKSIGLSYFKERGFLEDTIQKFGLGYAPNAADSLTREAVGKGHKIELLQKTGLANLQEKDFFRNRVIFPIHSLTGKIIAFAGRILTKEANAPKYINSPETEIYFKSKVLYGLFFAKKAIQQADECLLVEGYTDVISLHQSGIENVVASSGTSLTVEQIRSVKRYTNNIKIIYDGDPAGIKAALRGLNLILEEDMNVRIVLLPVPEDPDSYMKKVGATAFRNYIAQADDFIFFKTKLLLDEAGNDPIKKTVLIKDIVESIALVPDPIKRSLYVKECSTAMKVEERILFEEINKLVIKQLQKKQPRNSGSQAPKDTTTDDNHNISDDRDRFGNISLAVSGDEYQERDIARVLVLFGDKMVNPEENITLAHSILSNIEDVMDSFDNKLYHRIAQVCLELLVNGQPLTTNYFLSHDDPEISQFSVNMVSHPYEYSENWEKMWEIYLQTQKMPELNYYSDGLQALRRFKLRKIDRKRAEVQNKIKEFQLKGDNESLMFQLKIAQKLTIMRNDLARLLNIVITK